MLGAHRLRGGSSSEQLESVYSSPSPHSALRHFPNFGLLCWKLELSLVPLKEFCDVTRMFFALNLRTVKLAFSFQQKNQHCHPV